MITTIFFDLDGTLTDPGLGITNSVMYALRKMGFPVPEREKLYPFIGPPLKHSFQRFSGMSEVQAVEAIGCYREYFSDRGLFENELYPAIPGVLQALRDRGLTLAVATSKPEPFAEKIVSHFGLRDYFAAVCGATMEETRTEKHQVIHYALNLLHLEPASVLMVGDREHDVLGAKREGIPTIGVLYGYGSREELLSAGAVSLAKTPEDIVEIVRKQTEADRNLSFGGNL